MAINNWQGIEIIVNVMIYLLIVLTGWMLYLTFKKNSHFKSL